MSVDYNAASNFLGNDRKKSSGNGIGQIAVASAISHLLSERHDEHRWEKRKLLTEDLYHQRREREYARRRADRRDARAVAAEHNEKMAQARRARQTQWREQDADFSERLADKRHAGQLRRDAERQNQRREHMAKDFAVQAQGKGKIEQARAAGKVAGQGGNFPSDWTPRWAPAGPDPTKPASSQPAPVRSAPALPTPARSAPAAPSTSTPAVSSASSSPASVSRRRMSFNAAPPASASPSSALTSAPAVPRQSNVSAPTPAKPSPAASVPASSVPARPDPTKPANAGNSAIVASAPKPAAPSTAKATPDPTVPAPVTSSRPASIPVTRPPIRDEVDGMPYINRKRHPEEYARLDALNRKVSKQGDDVRVAGGSGRVSNESASRSTPDPTVPARARSGIDVGTLRAQELAHHRAATPELGDVMIGNDGSKRMGSDYVRGVQALGRVQQWVSRKLGTPKPPGASLPGPDAAELQHRLGDQKFAQGTIMRRDKQTGTLAPDMQRTGNVRVYPNPDKAAIPAASRQPAKKPAAPLPEGPMSRIRQISAGDSGVSVGNDAQPAVKRSHVPVPPAIASVSKGKPVSPTAPHRVWGNPLFTDKQPLIGDDVALKPKPNTLAPASSGMRVSNLSSRSSSSSGPEQTALNIPTGPKVAKVSQPKISRKGKSPKVNDNPLF